MLSSIAVTGQDRRACLLRALPRASPTACEPDEAEPLGLILCAGKNEERIALLELQKSGIQVASYWTEVLPKKELERKLREAVRLARARLDAAKD